MQAPVFLNITWHHLFCPRHTGSVWALIFPNCHPPQDLCTVYSCCLENTCSLLASCLVFFEVPVSVLPVGSLDKKNNLYQLSAFNVIYLFYNMCPIGYVVLLFLFDHILCPWWFLETLVFHQPVFWTVPGTWCKVNIQVYSSNAQTTSLIIQQYTLSLKNGLMVEKEILVSTGTRHALAGTRSYTKYGNYFLDSKI